MQVLHLHSGNLYGGVESCLTTLVREAQHAPQMQSRFALCFEGRFSRELAALGQRPELLGEVRLSRPQTVLRARAALRDVVRQQAPDVIVCQQPWSLVVFAPVLREFGYPLVLWVHMAGDGKHWLERAARLRAPDVVICNSRFSQGQLSQWLTRVPTQVAYCPVAAAPEITGDARRALRHRLGVEDDKVVVTMAARAEAWKGHRVLVEACQRMKDQRHWLCWLVGGAQRDTELAYMEELKALIDGAGLAERVRLWGARDDVRELLAASDVYCQPNLEPEPFGLSLIEAMYAGLPVVTTGAGGALEIVDETCGALTPAGDADAVAAALRRLCGDTTLRDRLGTSGRRRATALCAPDLQVPHIERVLGSWTRVGAHAQEGRRAG
jgi:glycosyltransferase involved in cell wall biosynthesis